MELGPLVKIISHDLRGPLGNMKNVADLFRMNEIEPDQAKMFMSHIEVGINRSLKLLDDLIEWSHASDEHKKIGIEVLDIDETIKEAIAAVKEKADRKSQVIDYKKAELSKAYVDRSALKMILKNLLLNAINFSPNDTTIVLAANEKGAYLQLSVSDKGIGIPSKMHATVFSMGKDNRRLGTNDEKGTGIGLFMCKDLVARNGGMIWIESSEEGKGTNIMFSIKKAADSTLRLDSKS
ncbi:MAG: HAMP domain-containing sensor histidine kinase [Bacteroidota bacterium]